MSTDPATNDSVDDVSPAAEGATSWLFGQQAPREIGQYHILDLISEGGMGAVYRAEQRAPVKRIVALKLIKPGMDTKEVIARFESERQALAMMDHPNIARVFDGGATEHGRPFFVMEYVPGMPITSYCDGRHMPIRDRLKLFAQVCDAVQHAHQKGIIHRDLKPSNILVSERDGQSVPKVIDFGVAKAMSSKLTKHTLFTEIGQVIGTPEYMSPEQAEMSALDVDTRADVYSLGVMLYELLTGSLPFDSRTLRHAAQGDIQRMIREIDPPRPSTRLSSLDALAGAQAARCRAVALDLLRAQLKRELEWIPLKAMRKDRTERYRTASELGDDIQNYLNDVPLLAAPESRTYRLRKVFRRHRRAVLLGTSVLVLLLAGIVGTTWGLLQARQQRAVAVEANEAAQAVREFLTEDVLAGATPQRISDKAIRDTIVKTMLVPASESIEKRLSDRPAVQAAIHDTLAQCYRVNGRADLGMPHARTALQLRDRALGASHPDTLASVNTLATLLQDEGHLVEAEPLFRRALEARRATLGDANKETLTSLNNLGVLLRLLGKRAESEAISRETVTKYREFCGTNSLDTFTVVANLALVLQDQGRLQEAEPLHREALDGYRRLAGEKSPVTLTCINNLGGLLFARGDLVGSERLFREAMDKSREILGSDHPDTLRAINNLAFVLVSEDKLVDAEALSREAMSRRRAVLGAAHAETISSINNVALLLQRQGKLVDAEPLFREALNSYRSTLGDKHPETLNVMNNLGLLVNARGRASEALPLFKELYEGVRHAQMPEEHIAIYMSRYGLCLANLHEYETAAAPLSEACRRLRQITPANQTALREVLVALVEVDEATGHPERAAQHRAELSALIAATRPATTQSFVP